jgi:hypothetical protein
MSTTTWHLRRRTTYGVVGALAAATLALTDSGPAQAANALTLRWGVSQYLNEHLTSQGFSNGATEDANGVVTFVAGTGTRSSTGAVTTSYVGTARYAFANPMTGAELYSLSFSDPQVVVDASGAGRVLSDVSWTAPTGPGSLTDTVVTTFATSSLSGAALGATPDWAGVAQPDAYGTGKPADGKSWAVAFVKAVPSSLNPFFYASGSANDAKKSPAALVAAVPAAAPTTRVSTTSIDATSGLTLRVDGQGFTAQTNPGDAGVYVGLAPAGGLPDVSSQTGMGAFAASAWVMPAQISNGAFTTTLNASPASLDPTKAYSIYTWQAHSHSNTSQDTETPVTINWAALRPVPAPAPTPTTPTAPTTTGAVTAAVATAVRGNWKTKATRTRAGKLKVALTTSASAEAGGAVKVVLKKKGTTRKLGSTSVRNGVATVAVPRLPRGTWKIVITYAGQPGSAPARRTMKLVVR